ncbi:hypothetical protein Rrhod_2376 [Rhodococcus rhodnii LMG 5362]|uniref:Uncharacterized protein n=1 Tax=Rhodococcus rhodnii LMG 5362 TaxID=1273125 RepID=R7WLT1_9NOCA|nr:hypothetical protein Rrhod_2376 [Rhodococcus rhodnii LMG 5362]
MRTETIILAAASGGSPSGIFVALGTIAAISLLVVARNPRNRARVIRWRTHRRPVSYSTAEERFHSKFDGRPIVTADPRRTTIAVSRMNAIANGYGYYYIGENGHLGVSTEVAFQKLPGPPPIRLPSTTNRWKPME